jgi:hypothetical protein
VLELPPHETIPPSIDNETESPSKTKNTKMAADLGEFDILPVLLS